MTDVITIENAELEHDAIHHEDTLARLSGRLKFACCRQCGSMNGIQAVHRETLEILKFKTVGCLAPWYSKAYDNQYLYVPCISCNPQMRIPNGFEAMSLPGMLAWLNTDPMAPDYAALGQEEPVSQIDDSRESAGL